MKAYKGFNQDMTCRNFQYEEGKEYHEDNAELCKNGFHACERPLDCFTYYAPANSVYHEVEINELHDKKDDDSKVCGKNIKIGAQLSVAKLCELQFEYVKSHCISRNIAGYRGAATAGSCGAATARSCGAATAGSFGAATAGSFGAATAGSCGAATAGDRGAATAGYRGAATAGYRGAATAGSCGAATAGSFGAATAGDCGAATAGYRGAATAGYRGAATAGSCGAATSRGTVSVGKNGVALCRGNGVKAKGGLGSLIVIAEECDTNYGIKEWKAAVVDGDEIKPDVWYKLENGEFVETSEEED